MKFAFVILSSFIALSSYADKVKLDIDMTQKYVVNAQNSNRYDLQSTNVKIKMFAKVDGQRASAEKTADVAGDGSYMIIGSDEVTQIDKAGKQTILAAKVSSDHVSFTEASADEIMAKITTQGASGKAKVSKTECSKDSTSVMTCTLSISATIRAN